MIKYRKGQMIEEVLKYGMVLFFAMIVVIRGYRFMASMEKKACESEIAKLELDMKNIEKNVRKGETELRKYKVPCNADKVYIFDLKKSIDLSLFEKIPIIKDSLETSSNNVFLIKNGKVLDAFYTGELEIDSPYYICFSTSGTLGFFVEGKAKSVRVASQPEQKLCS